MRLLNAIEVRLILAQHFAAAPIVADRDYACPTRAWLFNDFYPWYREQMGHYGVWKWDEKFDCDDYAASFRVFAQLCHRKTTLNAAQGLAVGECFHVADSGNGHAVNFAIVENEDLILIEPQNGKIYNTQNVRASAWHIRM